MKIKNSISRLSAGIIAMLTTITIANSATVTEAQNTGYLTVIMDFNRLRAAKESIKKGDRNLIPALTALQKEADSWLEQGPFTVMNKNLTPPSGDKHDYMSFGPYWWPNPAKKDGLPYIRRDGEVNPQSMGPGSDRVALENMAAGTETLALAWYFTGERKYADRAALFISTWFLDQATCMHPHLKYGQGIPGNCEGRGIGIIETRRFSQVINSISLLEGSETLTEKQRQALQEWFRTYLTWLCDSDNGKAESREINNHGTWYDVQVAHFALYTGQLELAKKILVSAQKNRLSAHVSADGSQKQELARTRAFTYSLINLSGLLALAELGRQSGVDYWDFPSAKKSLLKAAVDFMAVYADPKKTWTYQQVTDLNRIDLYPFLKQAEVFTGDRSYRELIAKLPEDETKTQRANLLWPCQN